MKLKGKTFRIRGKAFLKFGAVILSLAILAKALSFVNIEDGLSSLVNNPNISRAILSQELSSNFPTITASDIVAAQIPILTSTETNTPKINFTPWQPAEILSDEQSIKPMSVNPSSPDGYVALDKLFL